MTEKELADWCEAQIKEKPFIIFPDEIIDSLSIDIARNIVDKFSDRAMMKMPEREIIFFNWLKEKAPKIWKDLWCEDDEEPYTVSISFLPVFLDKNRGFPICDLLNNDNYYFTKAHFVDKESQIFIESVQKRFLAKEDISIAQMLTMEISIAPIDIWRFAYRHKVSITEAKAAVEILVEDGILVHLTEASHLANFIEL